MAGAAHGGGGMRCCSMGRQGGDEDQRRHRCYVDKGSGNGSIVHINIKQLHDDRQRLLQQKLRKGHRHESTCVHST